jgi:VWFA-related protein
VLHDFTNDASSLVRALARYHAITSREVAGEEAAADLGASGDPALDAELAAFLESASAEMTRHFGRLRAEGTMAALEAIANHLSAVQGRKNLIWISSGFPLQGLGQGGSITTAIQRATRPLNDANVTLHAVDARGLIGAITYGPRGRATFTTLSMVHTNLDILQIVSEETGGRTFYNTNDINSAVRRAVDDSRVSYTLGYYPAHGRWDGTYRQIKVRVNRPGVEVRHRKGYLAGNARSSLASKEAAAAEAVRSRAIRSALVSPLEATGIGMTARLERVAGTASDVKVIINTVPGLSHWSRRARSGREQSTS